MRRRHPVRHRLGTDDVKLNRLVERFNDARTVSTNLLNPDMITHLHRRPGPDLRLGVHVQYVGDKLAGRTPAGVIRVSDNLLDIVGRMKLTAGLRPGR